MRTTADRLSRQQALWRSLHEEPYRHDFYQTLRRLECLFADKPRIGRAARPADEAVRLGQEVSMSFAPAPIGAFDPGTGERPARREHRFFGLLGPNGPLPLHLSDHARVRWLHQGDAWVAGLVVMMHVWLLEL
jgi:type VI secretion system protein ImpH